MRIRDYLGISTRRQRQATRAMELALVGIFAIGLYERNWGVVVNAGVALAVTELPAVIERDFELPMDAGLTLWLTTAVFLHALGTIGLSAESASFYRGTWWWDHLTHTLSASVVAAVGYTTVRALDEHSEEVDLPPRFVFVFILLFTIAFGVVWEVLEFAIGGVAALVGTGSVLTQYGLEDTMKDLLFDTLGGVVVATWGTAYLSDMVGAVAMKFDRSKG
jgi:hypothetical protein